MIFLKTLFRACIVLILICAIGFTCFFIYYSQVFFVKETTIPMCEEKNLEEAKKQIKDANLEYEVVYILGANEVVLYTLPYGGSIVKRNSIVSIYVGAKQVEGIPDLVYVEFLEAEDILRGKQIEYEYIYIEDNTYEPDIVIKQEVLQNNILRLYISKRKENNELPALVGLFEEQAIALLKEFDIRYILNYEESFFPSGMVLSTNISGNSEVYKHNESLVILYIAK